MIMAQTTMRNRYTTPTAITGQETVELVIWDSNIYAFVKISLCNAFGIVVLTYLEIKSAGFE